MLRLSVHSVQSRCIKCRNSAYLHGICHVAQEFMGVMLLPVSPALPMLDMKLAVLIARINKPAVSTE